MAERWIRHGTHGRRFSFALAASKLDLVEARISTDTGLVRLLATVVLDADADTGIDILVLQGLDEAGIDSAAVALGLDLRESYDASALDAAQLPARITPFFYPDKTGDPEAVEHFIAQVVFTRQIPLESSPIERWSLAEIWTLAGTSGTVGLGYVSGTSWPVMLLIGTFGALLLRPLVAISQGVAEGLKPVVTETTEMYARNWLQRSAGTLGDKPSSKTKQETPRPLRTRRPPRRVTRATYTREAQQIVGNLWGRIEAVEEAARERLAPEDLAKLLELTEAARLSLKKLYDPLGDEGLKWDLMPKTLAEVGESFRELDPLTETLSGAGRFHQRAAQELLQELARKFDLWNTAEE
jgi:hypothetical protein